MWVALVKPVIVLIGLMQAVANVVVVVRMQELINLPGRWYLSADPVGPIVGKLLLDTLQNAQRAEPLALECFLAPIKGWLLLYEARPLPFWMFPCLEGVGIDAPVQGVEPFHFRDVVRRNRNRHIQFAKVFEEVLQLAIHAIGEQLIFCEEYSRLDIRQPAVIRVVG
ncbi:hypothetical protein D9M71_536110 [compost metagenome]